MYINLISKYFIIFIIRHSENEFKISLKEIFKF